MKNLKRIFITLLMLCSTLAFSNFSYKAQYNLKKGIYTLKFGHTHEQNLLIKFNDNAKEVQKVEQKETIKIDDTKVFDVKMAHLKGEIKLDVQMDQTVSLITSHAPGSALPYSLYDENGMKINFVNENILDNSKNDIYRGYFKDDMIKDRPNFSDWQGSWKSVYPLLLAGDLNSVMEAKAKKAGKETQHYIDYYKAGYMTDVERIDINNNTVTFYKNGKIIKGEYMYEGYKTLNYAKGNRGVRFLYTLKSGDMAAPKHLQFSDHNIYPNHASHFHLFFGNKTHEELFEEMENWPTYYPISNTTQEIIDDMLGH